MPTDPMSRLPFLLRLAIRLRLLQPAPVPSRREPPKRPARPRRKR